MPSIFFRPLFLSLVGAIMLNVPGDVQADVRLIGITGNMEANPAHDQSLWEIDQDNPFAAPQFLQQLTLIRDTLSMGFNPMENLIYRAGGGASWSDFPNRRAGGWPYRDNQYLETVNLDTGELTAIYNANGPNLSDPDNFFTPQGLPAPRPSWVFPNPARTLAQTNNDFRSLLNVGVGEHEIGAIRAFAWSQTERVFYVASDMDYRFEDPERPGTFITVENNLFRLTPDGGSTAVGSTGFTLKGLTFYHPAPGQTVLLGGDRDEGMLYTLDPTTADPIGDPVAVNLVDQDGTVIGPSGGLLGLAQDPVTGDLLGINHSSDATVRELLKIDPVTGNAEVIGLLRTSVDEPDAGFASIAFTGYLIGDMDQGGEADYDDVDSFALGLIDPAAYGEAFSLPSTVSGDVDGDGDHDFDDIPGFVGILGGDGTGAASVAVPEPSTVLLLCIGLAVLIGHAEKRQLTRQSTFPGILGNLGGLDQHVT